MTIRPANPGDATQILEIYRPAVEQSAISFELTLPTLDELKSRISDSSDRYPWIVDDQGGQIRGYAYARPFRPREAYRNSVESTVYVHADHRRENVGRALMEELMARLADAGHHLLIAGITLPNPASVALHERLGFQPVGVFPEVGRKFDRWHDVGFWACKLDGANPPN